MAPLTESSNAYGDFQPDWGGYEDVTACSCGGKHGWRLLTNGEGFRARHTDREPIGPGTLVTVRNWARASGNGPEIGETKRAMIRNRIAEWVLDVHTDAAQGKALAPGAANTESTKMPPNEYPRKINASDLPIDLRGKQIVVTGKIEGYTRDTINAAINKVGGYGSNEVTAYTHYLVIGERPGRGKQDDARRFATATRTASWLLASIDRTRDLRAQSDGAREQARAAERKMKPLLPLPEPVRIDLNTGAIAMQPGQNGVVSVEEARALRDAIYKQYGKPPGAEQAMLWTMLTKGRPGMLASIRTAEDARIATNAANKLYSLLIDRAQRAEKWFSASRIDSDRAETIREIERSVAELAPTSAPDGEKGGETPWPGIGLRQEFLSNGLTGLLQRVTPANARVATEVVRDLYNKSIFTAREQGKDDQADRLAAQLRLATKQIADRAKQPELAQEPKQRAKRSPERIAALAARARERKAEEHLDRARKERSEREW